MLTLIKKLDYAGIQAALAADSELANAEISLDDAPDSPGVHPLHRICDGIFSGWYSDAEGRKMAELFLAQGARVDGNELKEGQDSPLVAAASLHADQVGLLYINAGANIHHPGCYGGTALHWAAWCGRPVLLQRLLEEGAEPNRLCQEFRATPLFWAAHGLKNAEGQNVQQQGECIRLLLRAGADANTPNFEGYLPKDLLGEEWAKYSSF